MNKPIVHYRNDKNTMIGAVGSCAFVSPIDHNHSNGRVSNTTFVITSRIVRVGDNGEFETQNTVYRPQKAHA